MKNKRLILVIIGVLIIIVIGLIAFCNKRTNTDDDLSKFEHKINIISDDKMITANTGGFCYKNGACIDKIDFQDFKYDSITSYYGNKLYIENLDGTIKSIELFDYSTKEFIDTKVEFTNDYIITPSISGPYIFKINATYEGKSIEYYFWVEIYKISGKDINVTMELKEDSLTSVGLSMFVKNLSDKDLQYGNPYSLEKYEDGYWKNANVVNQLYFTLPAFSLKNNDSVELNVNWEYGYGKLNGKYRIVKRFSYKEKEDSVFFNKYLEFEI